MMPAFGSCTSQMERSFVVMDLFSIETHTAHDPSAFEIGRRKNKLNAVPKVPVAGITSLRQ